MELTDSLLFLGVDLVKQSLDILSNPEAADLSTNTILIPADQLDTCQILLNHLGEKTPGTLSEKEQNYLLGLALRYIPGIHKLAPLQPELEELILFCRKEWPRWSEKVFPGKFNPFQGRVEH